MLVHKKYHINEGKVKEIYPEKEKNRWSLSVTKDGSIYMAGIPKAKEIEKIEQNLRDIGIIKKFK